MIPKKFQFLLFWALMIGDAFEYYTQCVPKMPGLQTKFIICRLRKILIQEPFNLFEFPGTSVQCTMGIWEANIDPYLFGR